MSFPYHNILLVYMMASGVCLASVCITPSLLSSRLVMAVLYPPYIIDSSYFADSTMVQHLWLSEAVLAVMVQPPPPCGSVTLSGPHKPALPLHVLCNVFGAETASKGILEIAGIEPSLLSSMPAVM